MSRRSARTLGGAFIGLSLLASFLLTTAFIYELVGYDPPERTLDREDGLRLQASHKVKNYDYIAFFPQYLHPIYLFFYPLDPNKRVMLSNKTVHLTREGFRGGDPTFLIPLGFVLGGSAAFGWEASRDQTTITGFLNDLQNGLQFINAGVPAWTSTQELERLINQIILFKPNLVISYSLFNDITIARSNAINGSNLPPGSPEHFDELVKRVSGQETQSLLTRLFPHTARLLDYERERLSGQLEAPTTVPVDVNPDLDAAARKFVQNEEAMQALSKGMGFRFVTVIQPMLFCHKKRLDSSNLGWEWRYVVEKVLNTDYCKHNCVNYSAVFDQEFDTDEIEKHIFVDEVHLSDDGNKYIANHLLNDLGLRVAIEQAGLHH